MNSLNPYCSIIGTEGYKRTGQENEAKITIFEKKLTMYSAATVIRPWCVSTADRTNIWKVQISIHTRLRKLYVGIKVVQRETFVRIYIAAELIKAELL